MERNPRPVEVSSDELLDAILAFGVDVLELMHGRELLHVQTVGSDDVWVRGKRGGEGERECLYQLHCRKQVKHWEGYKIYEMKINQ